MIATIPVAGPGHCSQCHKVWTLVDAQGVCQWCGKQSSCQDTTRHSRAIKSRVRARPERPVLGDGYDQLSDPYLTYYKVARRVAVKVPVADQPDLLHDIMIQLDRVSERKRATGETVSAAMLYRIADHIKDHYWYEQRKRTSGLDCQHCSTKQRHKCKEGDLYSQCRKLIKIEDLHKPIIDGEGNLTELGNLIADDTAIDLAEWADAKTLLLGLPQRLKRIAVAIRDGNELSGADKTYLHKLRKRYQKSLF